MSEARAEAPGRVHPVDEVLSGRLAVLGFQHVLAMYAGAVAVPLILASAIGLPEQDLVYLINADLFTCGVATLIQTAGFWKVGFRLPIIQAPGRAHAPETLSSTPIGGGWYCRKTSQWMR